MKLIIAFALSLMSSAYAVQEAKVMLLKGSATYEGKPIAQGETLKGNGQVKVDSKSYVKIQLNEGGHVIAFAPDSVGKLNFNIPSESETIDLVKGYARWISGSGKKKLNSGFRTKNATMGIRGTNFMSLYNSDLGETEIWVFDGQVEFTNAANKVDSKSVGKNQWGGIGGRFGKKCQEILTLSDELISKVGGILPVE